MCVFYIYIYMCVCVCVCHPPSPNKLLKCMPQTSRCNLENYPEDENVSRRNKSLMNNM